MTTVTANGVPSRVQGVRCFTRALKNAMYLQEVAPNLFAMDATAEGLGTGIPMKILGQLHRLSHDSPKLQAHGTLATFLKENALPVPGNTARDPLFNGTIYFAQITFQTATGNLMISTADMNTIVQYAQRAIVPISEYAAQYGSNSVKVSPSLITHTVKVSNVNGKPTYTDADVQTWVNDIVKQNRLPTNCCVAIVSPDGLAANNVGDNSGYHMLAGTSKVPYILFGVYAHHLELRDLEDRFAMVVSHEIAEMIVDPNANSVNPEVCDPCDTNCQTPTRIYFDVSNIFLGANQNTPPSGFNFSYYICAIVKPSGASSCPAASGDCAYAPTGGTLSV